MLTDRVSRELWSFLATFSIRDMQGPEAAWITGPIVIASTKIIMTRSQHLLSKLDHILVQRTSAASSNLTLDGYNSVLRPANYIAALTHLYCIIICSIG